jgi:hypothetical protein
MARILFQAGRFQDSGLGISLAEAGIPVGIEKIAQFVNEDKDQACAFVSAMTALLLYMGWGVVLGNEGMGSFVLPAGALWHPGWHGKISGALNRFRVDEGGELELRELP